MENHFKGFFKACATEASARKRPGKRERHEKVEARASAKRFRRAAGEVSSAHASSTCSSVSGDAAHADAGRLLQEQKNVTVSFHNSKSNNFKLSVSNPKSKYVAYVSVLSQISNCQGLGRKNKHENLKTDRMWRQAAYPSGRSNF